MFKFNLGDPVRCVRGPGGHMEAHPKNIGKVGKIVACRAVPGAPNEYDVVMFGGMVDQADETCLEAV